MRDNLVIEFAKEIVEQACKKNLTAEELKYACGWASCAPYKRIDTLSVVLEDAAAIMANETKKMGEKE